MKQKHWKVSVFDQTSETIKNDMCYATDTEVYLVFELIDEDFTPDSATVTVYNTYGKATIHASVEVADGIVNYKIPVEAIRHAGDWRTQVVFTKDNEDYTTEVIEFEVGGHLLGNKKPSIVVIENWNRFMKHAEGLIEDWEQLEEIRQTNEQQRELAESVRQNEFETNETSRQVNELVREKAEGNRQSEFEENELARESAESVRVSNEEERISKDSERDSKIEAIEDNLESKANKQQEDWIRPTILNGWVNNMNSSVYPPTSFMKDEFGFVHIRGHMSEGEDETLFILPVDYRPPHHMSFAVANHHLTGTQHTNITVRRDGIVKVQGMVEPRRPSLNVSFKAVES